MNHKGRQKRGKEQKNYQTDKKYEKIVIVSL